jgi:hypothetical protein
MQPVRVAFAIRDRRQAMRQLRRSAHPDRPIDHRTSPSEYRSSMPKNRVGEALWKPVHRPLLSVTPITLRPLRI